MRSGPLQSFGLAFAFLMAAGFPGLSSKVTTIARPIQLMAMTEVQAGQGGHFMANASINGTDVQVLVDTGATTVALSYEDAQRIGLRPNTLSFNVPVNTANGTSMAARVTLRDVKIDNVKVENVDGMVTKQGTLNGTLLGMSYLGKLQGFKVEDGTLYLKN